MNKEINKMDVRQRLLDGLFEAEKQRMSAEHYMDVIMPISGDNKLFVRSLERIYSGLVLVINRVLQFEYFLGNVSLYKEKDKNLGVFLRLAKTCGLNEREIGIVREILFMGRQHRESGIEFSRRKGFVILDDNLKHYSLNESKIREFLAVERKLLVVAGNLLKTSVKAR